MAIKTKVGDEGDFKDDWITDKELQECYPELWEAAREKVARIEAAWAPKSEKHHRDPESSKTAENCS